MKKYEKEVQKAFLNNEEAVIKELKKTYDQSLIDISAKVKKLDLNIGYIQKALSEIEDDDIGDLAKILLGNKKHLTPEEAKETLKSMLQSKVYQKNYQTALKNQVSGILDKMHQKEFTTVSDYLVDCYDNGFMGAMYSLQNQGIPMCIPIDQTAMVRAVQLDSKIKKSFYESLGENVADLKKTIVAEVSRGISTGMSYTQVAQQIKARMVGNYDDKPGGALYRAMTIARTEGHRVQVQSAMNASYSAKEKGADVLKQWDAALDSSTRESHAKVDGEIRELDKPFSNGLMFPGDPSGGAAEVINCRCALLQRARWALDDDELETLKERAKYFGLDKTANFEEYKEKYLKAAEKQSEVKVAKKSAFVPVKTTKEAEAFISQFVDDKQFGATGISYSGISVDSANAVNEALANLFSTFKIDKLGGVYVPKGNTKLGKAIDGATAAYSPIRKSLLLNRNSLKNIDDVAKNHAIELDLVKKYSADPSSLVFKTRRAEAVIKASVKSGRSTVPETITEVINHEMGHAIESVVRKSDNYGTIKFNMPHFAESISGYATTSEGEYIAESFASYLKGEKIIDPELAKVFEGLKR